MQPLPSFMIMKFYDTQMFQKFALLEYMSTTVTKTRDKFWGETIILNGSIESLLPKWQKFKK